MTPSWPDLSRLLAPASIAVVGASDEPGNFGGASVRFMRKFGSPCAVWPVNPRRDTVAGLPCYPSLAALPGPPDLAVLAVPARAVEAVVRECVAAGTGAAVVWAGGFADGGPDGLVLQEALAATCRQAGLPMLGPNCIGLIDAHRPVVASFASMMLGFDRLLPGAVSMVSQSGGLATMTQALAQRAAVGFRFMVSTGNEAVLTAADLVAALVDDPGTAVIGLYIEAVRDAARLGAAMAAARRAGKPVVLLQGGTGRAGARAAVAHTGAGPIEAGPWQAALRLGAVIPVVSLTELVDVAGHLGRGGPALPTGHGVAIVTFGGGLGVVAADQCEAAGLPVPALAEHTRRDLAALAPPLAALGNPVDLTPQTYADPRWLAQFPRVLDRIAADPAIGSVLFCLGPMARDEDVLAGLVAAFIGRTAKPAVVAWPLATAAALAPLRQARVAVLPDTPRAVRVLASLTLRSRPV